MSAAVASQALPVVPEAEQQVPVSTPAPATLADALEEAQQRIVDLLTHPDDLNTKLAQLKTKFSAEKASIDAILKTSVQSQLDDTQDGLQLLSNGHEVVTGARKNLATIDQISADTRAQITNYARIKRVSKTHKNFMATREVVERFQALNKDIEQVAELIDADAKDIMDDAPNLLLVHHQLYRLEEFRDLTLHKSKSQGAAVMQVITKYFKRLDILSERFRDYIWSLTKSMIELVQNNQGSVIVRLLKIIEAEERADEQVLMAQQLRANNQQLAGSNEWRVMEENPRIIKNYRSQLFNVLHDAIADMFLKRLQDHESSVSDALDTCRFVFEDLALVCDELVPRFPPKYKIFSFYVLQYHKHVYDLLNRLVHRNLETGDILRLTGWVRDYYTIMSDRLGVTEELLEPRLLDDNEDSLIQEYVKLLQRKLLEWVDRLLDSESVDFTLRTKPPDTETEEFYSTAAPIILFQMLNQQIDIAAEAARGGKLLLDVAQECFSIMQYFQTKQLQLLESEESRFLARTADFPGGFPEYTIAMANNHLKCSEFVETLQKKLDTQLDEKYRGPCSQKLSEAMEGFMKVARRCNTALINIAHYDIAPVFAQLHTPAWYEKQLMPLITATLDDYFRDYKQHLQDYLFTKLTTDFMDKFLAAYIDSFRPKAAKFRMPQAVNQMTADVAGAVRFWSEYKSPKRVRQAFDIFEKIVALLESSPTTIFLSWYALWKAYNDVPIGFIEDLLYKRDDLDKASIKEAIANCKQKAKEGNPDAQPSIFSKTSQPEK